MAWYTTGTIAVSGTTVTGTGTNFLDNTQSIGPGQALLIPGSGTVKMYEIASVQSATKLTLKTSAGTVAAGQAYAILTFYTDSVPDFSRRLAAQLSYYQSQMDGWQQIMTGTGSITMTAPDGTTVTISSFSKLTADIASAFQQRGNIGSNRDLNTMGPTSDFVGIWGISTTADLTGLTNSPESNGGELDIYPYGSYGCTQKLTTRNGNIWVRCPTATWTVSNPNVWGAWCLVGSMYYSSNTKDMNTLLTPFKYFSNNITNGPSGMASTLYAFIDVEVNTAMNIVKQTLEYSASGRIFKRACNNGTWNVWSEIYTTTSKPTIADLGLVARANLNTELFNNLFATGGRTANTQGPGAYTFNNTPFGTEQYGVCLQLSNQTTTSGSAGSGIWQHYLALGTGGNIIYARNINSTYSANKLYSTANTTTNSSGALVPASPIVRIVNDRDAVTRTDILGVDNAEYTWSTKRGLYNEESKGCTVSRSDVGTYLVKGAAGLAKDLWTVMDCGNGQGRIIALAEAEETADGIVVRCYKQKYSLSDDGDLTIEKGTLIDIPNETWIDVRLEMPADSDYNLRQKEIADQMQAQENDESGS